MSTIVTRSGKGSPLTNTEVDANFTNLNTDKLELSGGTLTGNLNLGDNVKATFGGSNDLALWHDGANSRILDAGTGFLAIGTNGTEIRLTGQSFDEFMAKFEQDGPVTLYHNHSPKIATTSSGISVTGSVVADGLTVDGSADIISSAADIDALQINDGTYGLDLGMTSTGGIIGTKNVNQSIDIKTYGGASTSTISNYTNNTKRFNIANNGDISFYNDSAAQGFFFDSSTSRLGLGTTVPATAFEARGESLFGSGTDGLKLTYSAGNDTGIIDTGYSSTGVEIRTGNVERARFTSNGLNVLGSVTADGLTLHKASTNADVTYAKMRMDSWGFSTGKLKSIEWSDVGNAVAAIGAEYDGSKTNIHFHSQYNGGFKGTSERTMSIMGNGNVGIGTSSPSDFAANASNLVVGSGSGTEGITINSGTANYGVIYFADGTSGSAAYAGNINYNHADNSMRLGTNGSTTDVVIDNQGRVGIGTSSPSAVCDIVGSPVATGDARYELIVDENQAVATGRGGGLAFARQGVIYGGIKNTASAFSDNDTDMHFQTRLAGTVANKMVIKSSGNVGIGTSSPDTLVHAYKASNAILKVAEANGYASLQQSGVNSYLNNVASGGSLIFRNGTAPTERMRIRADGEVEISGIGNTTGARLNVGSDASNAFVRSYDTAQGFIVGTANATPFKVMTNSLERMRINASGDWMVSNTVANVASGYSNQAGCGWRDSDTHFEIATTSSNRSALEVGKNNANDGGLVSFRKQSNPVGSIGVSNTDLYIGSTDHGIKFHDTSNAIMPWIPSSNSADSSGTLDLGTSLYKFKDLYLSGISYVGGLYNTGIYNQQSGDIQFWVTNVGEAVRIQQNTGNLLVGTTSVGGSGITVGKQYGGIDLTGSGGTFANWGGAYGIYPRSNVGLGIASVASMSFETGGGNERMIIDASGTVKISHADTASEGLRVIQTTAARTSGGALGLFYDDQSGTTQPTLKVIQNGTGDILQLFDGGSQVVTVQDGGNLLVGTTVSPNTLLGASSTQGLAFNGGAGYLVAAANNNPTAYFNRQGSDGSIVEFRKNGTATVGSIGVDNNDNIYLEGVSGGIQIGTDAVLAHKNGTTINGGLDLGLAHTQWKDLYLSGGVYLGGTGAANKLDDYEEGTCNLKWSDGTNHSSSVGNKYTKVGRLVTVSGYVAGNVSGLTGTAVAQIAGFPFAFSDYGSFAVKLRYIDSPTGCIGIVGDHANSGSFANLSFIVDNGNYASVLVSDLSINGNDTYFNITYTTT